jgi:hypothetical protein
MRPIVIPSDFPRPTELGSVPGAQAKLLVREEAGRFASAAATDFEVQTRYALCEDLVKQLLMYTARKRAERPDWTALQVQQKAAASLRQKAFGWGLSPAEAEWIVRRLEALEAGDPAAPRVTS